MDMVKNANFGHGHGHGVDASFHVENNVMTLLRYCVKTLVLAVFGPLWPCFSTDLLRIWYRHGHGIGVSYHVKINVIALVTLRRNDVINIDLKVGSSEPRGFCD